jgi:uncharacterized protein YjbI with pentapeptide repeats
MALDNAGVKNCDFSDAVLIDIAMEGSEFVKCDFRGANLSWRLAGSKRLGRASDSIFMRCDFQGADFSGFRISGCRFVECLFYGAKGAPELDQVTVSGVDLSVDGDGSGVTDDDSFLERWKSGALGMETPARTPSE